MPIWVVPRENKTSRPFNGMGGLFFINFRKGEKMKGLSVKNGKEMLVLRTNKKENTVIKVKGCIIGGEQIVVAAGPCAVENEEMIKETAFKVRGSGAVILRAGAYKPRTSPYSFQGLGETGLKILAKIGEEMNMPVVTEVMDSEDIPLVAEYADILQVGARNMHNFSLLRKLGKINKPVVLKRGLAATIEEWLLAAEYILAGGNEKVILCERGIRTSETWTRNTLDLSAAALVKEISHLPVLVDPSHATGIRSLVIPMSKAAIAAGADGIMVEVHPEPDKALSDGEQSLTPRDFSRLVKELEEVARAVKRKVR